METSTTLLRKPILAACICDLVVMTWPPFVKSLGCGVQRFNGSKQWHPHSLLPQHLPQGETYPLFRSIRVDQMVIFIGTLKNPSELKAAPLFHNNTIIPQDRIYIVPDGSIAWPLSGFWFLLSSLMSLLLYLVLQNAAHNVNRRLVSTADRPV